MSPKFLEKNCAFAFVRSNTSNTQLMCLQRLHNKATQFLKAFLKIISSYERGKSHLVISLSLSISLQTEEKVLLHVCMYV